MRSTRWNHSRVTTDDHRNSLDRSVPTHGVVDLPGTVALVGDTFQMGTPIAGSDPPGLPRNVRPRLTGATPFRPATVAGLSSPGPGPGDPHRTADQLASGYPVAVFARRLICHVPRRSAADDSASFTAPTGHVLPGRAQDAIWAKPMRDVDNQGTRERPAQVPVLLISAGQRIGPDQTVNP